MEHRETITIKGKILPYYPRYLTNDINAPVQDISIAKENLAIFKDLADEYKLPVILMYGTLLGAIRENSFLKHDTDTDITIDIKHENILLEMIPKLEKEGLLFIRYYKFTIFNKGTVLYSFIRNEMWIDIYLMQKGFNCYIILGMKYPKKHFAQFESILFYNNNYLIPHNYEELLALIYGDDWRIPKANFHAPVKNIIFRVKLYMFLSNIFSNMPFIKNNFKKIARFLKWIR